MIGGLVKRFMLHPAWRVSRGMTLGVRGLVFDRQGRVLVVRHTYAPGWMLPGGGVERGETPAEALRRELAEEAGCHITGRPRLLGLYSNEKHFKGDYVALYEVSDFRMGDWAASAEITERRFMAPADLAKHASPATLRRLAEHRGRSEPDEHW